MKLRKYEDRYEQESSGWLPNLVALGSPRILIALCFVIIYAASSLVSTSSLIASVRKFDEKNGASSYMDEVSEDQRDKKNINYIIDTGRKNNSFYHSSLALHRIPHILIITFQTNILNMPATIDPTEEGPRFSAKQWRQKRLCLENVLQTIQMYVTAWLAQDNEYYYVSNYDKPRVWSLDDKECERVIAQVNPPLVPYFRKEGSGRFKGDICRVAALYLSGGYYFDVDMKAIQPVSFAPTTTFSSALMNEHAFFNSYIVAAPRHPIVLRSLQIMLHYYQRREKMQLHFNNNQTLLSLTLRNNISFCKEDDMHEDIVSTEEYQSDKNFRELSQTAVCYMMRRPWRDADIGTSSLKASYDYYLHTTQRINETEDPGQELHPGSGVELLHEDNLFDMRKRLEWYPSLKFQDHGVGCCCHFTVHSRTYRQPYFFSRFVGKGLPCNSQPDEQGDISQFVVKQKKTATYNESTGINFLKHLDIEYYHLPE